MLEKSSEEGAEVVSQLVYNEELQQQQEHNSTEIENRMMEWLLQESVMFAGVKA